MSGIILFLTSKIPDAEVKISLSHTRTVPPLTYIHPNCRFITILFPMESSYQCRLTTVSIANKHELHAIKPPGTAKLAIQVVDAITTLLLQVFRWIIEVLESTQIEVGEVGKSSHLSRERRDVRIITENERVECGEGANTERHIVKQILGQIERADGWRDNFEWQVGELVIGEIENCEARGPLCYIWDLSEFVVGEIELSQARQLKETLWDCGQLIVLEINLNNL